MTKRYASRVSAALSGLFLIITASAAMAQASPPPRGPNRSPTPPPLPSEERLRELAKEFRSGPPVVRSKILRLLVGHSAAPSPQTFEIIREGLRDSDVEVRKTALLTVAGRAANQRFLRPAVSGVTATAQAGAASPDLADHVWNLLDDPEAQIRHAAVLAVANLDLQTAATESRSDRLSPELSNRLAKMYRTELDGAVRAEIVKGFALLPDIQASSFGAAFFALALDDAEPDVLAYAARGVASWALPQLTPQVSLLLQSDHVRVRLAAAQSLGAFGSRSSGFLGALQKALAAEADPVVRVTLSAAILAVQRE